MTEVLPCPHSATEGPRSTFSTLATANGTPNVLRLPINTNFLVQFSPQAHPLEKPLELSDPSCHSSQKLQTTFPSHNTHQAQGFWFPQCCDCFLFLIK